MKIEDDHFKLSLSISEETADHWLHGEGNQLAVQDEVFGACLHWLYFYPRGLARSVLEEIVWMAMAEAFADFRNRRLSVHDTLISLQRSLNRLRAREDRRRRREIPLDDLSEEERAHATRSRSDHQGTMGDSWSQIAELIERQMIGALLSLSLRDQAILIRSYGLEEISGNIQGLEYPDFPSATAEAKAGTRARNRFNQHLEDLLATEVELAKPSERPLYEGILRLIQGGKLPQVLELLEARRAS
jgi:hypothetical protein